MDAQREEAATRTDLGASTTALAIVLSAFLDEMEPDARARVIARLERINTSLEALPGDWSEGQVGAIIDLCLLYLRPTKAKRGRKPLPPLR